LLLALTTGLNGYETGFSKSQTPAKIPCALWDIAIHNAEVSNEFGFSISTTGVHEQQGSEYQISVVGTPKKTY